MSRAIFCRPPAACARVASHGGPWQGPRGDLVKGHLGLAPGLVAAGIGGPVPAGPMGEQMQARWDPAGQHQAATPISRRNRPAGNA